jgi:hypothetical protein
MFSKKILFLLFKVLIPTIILVVKCSSAQVILRQPKLYWRKNSTPRLKSNPRPPVWDKIYGCTPRGREEGVILVVKYSGHIEATQVTLKNSLPRLGPNPSSNLSWGFGVRLKQQLKWSSCIEDEIPCRVR